MGALDSLVRAGQGALRRHLVLLRRSAPARPWRSCGRWAPRCSSTSRRTRCSTAGSRRTCSTPSARPALGLIAFSPLAQGMLTNKYLKGIPEGSRAAQGKSLDPELLTDESLKHVRALDGMAKARGQSLAQMALAWALRDTRVTSVLIGASSVEQLDNSLDAVKNLDVHRGGAEPRSTSTPSTPASTCGRPRARSELHLKDRRRPRRDGRQREPTDPEEIPMPDTDYLPSPRGWVRKPGGEDRGDR